MGGGGLVGVGRAKGTGRGESDGNIRHARMRLSESK